MKEIRSVATERKVFQAWAESIIVAHFGIFELKDFLNQFFEQWVGINDH